MSKAREAWETIVASMLKPRTARDARSTYGLLAELLRKDLLPRAGRDFLADRLEAIARGGDPAALVPKGRGRKRRASAMAVLASVECERLGRRAAHGDMGAIYESVARRLELTPGTAQKMASHARARCRQSCVESIAAGADRRAVVSTMAEMLNRASPGAGRLPNEVVENLLK